MNIKDLYNEKGRLAELAQNLIKEVGTGEWTPEQDAKFAAISTDIDKVNAKIAKAAVVESAYADLGRSAGRQTVPGVSRDGQTSDLREFLLYGKTTDDHRRRASQLGVDGNAFVLSFDQYTQSVGNNDTGGYAAQPNMIQAFVKAQKAFGGATNFGRTITTGNGNPLPWVLSNQTAGMGALVGEHAPVANVEFTISKTELNAFKFTSNAVPVSIEALQDIDGFEGFIGETLGERIGRAESYYAAVGTGNTSQPQGLFVGASSAAANGNTTVLTSNVITSNTLLDIEHSVNPAYRPGSAWGFNDTTFKYLRKLTNATSGEPVWQAGMQVGAPDTIYGYPYLLINEGPDMAAANTNTSPIVFGSRDAFITRRVKDVVLLKLDQIAALSGQVVFVAFTRMDSMVLDAGTHPLVKFKHDRTGE